MVVVAQHVALARAGEAHRVLHPLVPRDAHEPGELGARRGIGQGTLAADDEEERAGAGLAAKPREAAHRVVHPLARHHAAELERHEGVRRQAQHGAGDLARDGRELGRVDAAGHLADAGGVGGVERLEVVAILRALGDHQRRLAGHALLDGAALGREAVRLALVPPAHAPERVEGHREGDTGGGRHLGRDEAREEEVGVDQVGTRAPAMGLRPGGEGRHVGQQRLLRDGLGRPRGDVEHAHAVEPVHGVGQVGAVAAGEHLDPPAAAREMAGDLGHVDVLPAAVGPAERAQGRGVLRDQDDPARGRGGREVTHGRPCARGCR